MVTFNTVPDYQSDDLDLLSFDNTNSHILVAGEKINNDYFGADEKVNNNYFGADEKVNNNYFGADEKVNNDYLGAGEKVNNVYLLGNFNLDGKNHESVIHFEELINSPVDYFAPLDTPFDPAAIILRRGSTSSISSTDSSNINNNNSFLSNNNFSGFNDMGYDAISNQSFNDINNCLDENSFLEQGFNFDDIYTNNYGAENTGLSQSFDEINNSFVESSSSPVFDHNSTSTSSNSSEQYPENSGQMFDSINNSFMNSSSSLDSTSLSFFSPIISINTNSHTNSDGPEIKGLYSRGHVMSVQPEQDALDNKNNFGMLSPPISPFNFPKNSSPPVVEKRHSLPAKKCASLNKGCDKLIRHKTGTIKKEQKPTAKIVKKKAIDKNSTKYLERRRKNNIAAKACRQKKKDETDLKHHNNLMLETENKALKKKIAILEKKLAQLIN
eukprot:Awhi_evm2s13344